MTGGAVFPLLFSFTMPLLLGNLLQQTYSLIDAAIVGKFLGINSLAAVGASTSVIFLILGFCNGCCAGFGIPVAQKFGARDYATMRRYVAVGLQLATVMSVVIAAVSGFYCRDILRGCRHPGISSMGPMIICLLLLSVFLVHSSIICWQVSCGLWEIARLHSGSCCSLRS